MPKPDKSLVEDQLQALQAMLKAWGVAAFCASMFWVLDKKDKLLGLTAPTRIVPFQLNPIQLDLLAHLDRNNLLLKARQMGGTTFFLLVRGLLSCITARGNNALLLSQKSEMAETHFLIAQRAERMFGVRNPFNDDENNINISFRENLLHTKFVNKRELYFDQLESRLAVESAEVTEGGQGLTVHHLIASEYSRWPKNPAETLANARGALAPDGTTDIECTANGAVGSFYEKFSLAMNSPELSDAKAHFYPWFDTAEYRLELTGTQEEELRNDLKEDERRLIDAFRLDLQQVAWRRRTKMEFPGVEFDEKYPDTWTTAFIVSGKSYFDRDIIAARRMELMTYTPLRSYHSGEARIFKKRLPGRRYVIGADTASGTALVENDPDYCAAVVLDLETGEECAAYRSRVRPEEFAYDLADLGNAYNTCPILVERNMDGGTTILVLAGDCRYPAVMKTKMWEKREKQKQVIELEGFKTTIQSRPVALNFLNRFVKEHPEWIWDSVFLDEAMVFVRNARNKPEATPGAHDDTVLCRAFAHTARAILLGYYNPESGEKYLAADRL